ncbi:Txe/YoeB family addiction module toxin [Pedobacter changchengzhani]|uniref:Txe/YoeB family addiction module toxin n=1 Tax=Pedobacter changchengzhani TaxID=2529274 RepID=UPI001FB6E01C|nr:Txe/YoeB family addiction module toxin [Pedobacter changchengzhani]
MKKIWQCNNSKENSISYKSILASPFEGIGKPEALKYNLSEKWSRRINSEHRIIYEILETEQIIKIYSLRGHY